MKPSKFLDQVHQTAAKATRKGGRLKLLTSFEWDVSGRCQRPIVRTIHGRPSPKTGKEIQVNNPDRTMTAVPMTGEITVRCRKCDPCLQFRMLEWRDRMRYEIRQGIRTWFGTLTIEPEIQFRMLLQAERKYNLRSGYDPTDPNRPVDGQKLFKHLSVDEQFKLHSDLVYSEVQKYFKRIRKKNPSGFKYVVVFEKHTEKLAGFPHVHFLLHERSGAVRHRELKGEWALGITTIKLCEDEGAAAYLTKYLMKDASTKIRASTDYGREPRDSLPTLAKPEYQTDMSGEPSFDEDEHK